MRGRALVLGSALFPACLVVHELGHLALLVALGGHGQILVRPWRFQFLHLALPSLHVSGGEGLDPLRRVAFDLGGPLLAAVPLVIARIRVQGRALQAALLANILILGFYSLLETTDYLLDLRLGAGPGFPSWEEFNYGLPGLTLIGAAYLAGRWQSSGGRPPVTA